MLLSTSRESLQLVEREKERERERERSEKALESMSAGNLVATDANERT